MKSKLKNKKVLAALIGAALLLVSIIGVMTVNKQIVFAKDGTVLSMLNPIEALAWMHAGNIPDLIISDVNMPEMDGRTFLKQLKASSTFNFIPVIILSSLESSNDRIELLEAGASDFVLKPFNPQELKIRVRNLLR